MVTEIAFEQYRFTCLWCRASWYADYDLYQVSTCEGEDLSFYRRAGLACEAPAAAETICPTCHRSRVQVALHLRRTEQRPGSVA